MPFVDSDGVNIYYNLKGAGTPMLLCNGWGGSSDSWSKEMINRLAERHTLVLVDNRGTGRSGKPDEHYTMEQMSGDSATVLNEANLGSAHVLGFSMGGYIAEALALYHPRKVRSLILCATTAGAVNRIPYTQEVAAELAKVSDHHLPKRERVKTMVNLLYPKSYAEPRLEQLITEESYDSNPTPVYALRNQSAATTAFDAYDRLPLVKAPALILAGELDRLIPPENSRMLASRLPDSELHILPGLGHGFLKQDTSGSIKLIIDFTKRVDARNP
jgi:pimeloyl-ACP methyl ester carboxylesterase